MLGAQAAHEQERRDRALGAVRKADQVVADHGGRRDQDLRTRALELAQGAAVTGIIQNDQVVATATSYFTFIKGETHG